MRLMGEPVRRVLGIDAATRTGAAWWEAGRGVVTERIDCGVGRGEPWGHRYAHFADALRVLVKLANPQRIVYELPPLRRGLAAVRVLCGLEAVLLVVAEEAGVEAEGVDPNRLKRFVCGGGRASKEDVALVLRERLGLPGGLSEDEYDAAALWAWGAYGGG